MSKAWWEQNWLGVVQTIGVLGAAIGLLMTYFQLVAANRQIEQAQTALRANTIFTIQKDGRELFQSLTSDPKVYAYVFDLSKGQADEELKSKARTRVGQLINYYASVYNQYKAEAVDEKFWKTGLYELCLVLATPLGRSVWQQITTKGAEGYQPGFLKEGEACQQKI